MTFNEQLAKYLTETWSYQKNVKILGKTQIQGINIFNPAENTFGGIVERVGSTYTLITNADGRIYSQLPSYAFNMPRLKYNTTYTFVVVVSNNNVSNWFEINAASSSAFTSNSKIIIPAYTNGTFRSIYKTREAFTPNQNLWFYGSVATEGQTVDVKLMIAEGETDAPYEDFIPESTIPSPYAPVAYASVGNNIDIVIKNQNLALIEEMELLGSQLIYFYYNTFNPTHKTLTISFKVNMTSYATMNGAFLGYYRQGSTSITYLLGGSFLGDTPPLNEWVSGSYTITAATPITSIWLYNYGSMRGVLKDLIISEEPTDFIPAREEKFSIQIKDADCNPIELYADAGNTKDEIDVDRGVLIRRMEKYTLGSEANEWYINVYSGNNFATTLPRTNNLKIGVIQLVMKATHFKTGYSSGGVVNGCYIRHRANDSTPICFYPFADMGDGVAEGDSAALKAWLLSLERPFELYFPAGSIQEIPLHPTTIAQLKSVFLRRPDDDSEYNLYISADVTPEITYETFKWQEPVFDRTLQNAKNARMGIQADFAKGIFSDTVWNRIKGNQIVIKYLISWFYEYIPVELLDLAVKKQDLAGFASWADVESWITDLDLNEMATNDRTLMKQLPTAHANYVPPKNDYVGGLGSGSTSPDWNDLNLLERTLQLIKETILSTIANYRICGEPITSANPQQIDII